MQKLLDREQVTPTRMHGVIPLCMAQYPRTFGTTRIPGEIEGACEESTTNSKQQQQQKQKYTNTHSLLFLSPPSHTPFPNVDTISQVNSSRHIAVMCGGHIYIVTVIDELGRILLPLDLEK